MKFEVTAYVDSSHGSGMDRRSIYGYVIMINGTPLLFKMRKQRELLLGTTGSGFVAMSVCLSHLKSLVNLLNYLRRPPTAVRILGDNAGALNLVVGALNPQRTKHIDTRYHFARCVVQKCK